MALSAQIALSVIAHETTSGDISSQMRVTPATCALMLTDGTGANKAQVAWSSATTVGGSSANVLTIRSLSDDRGTVSLTSVKAIYIRNKSAANRLTVTTQSWTSLSQTLLPFNLLIPAGGACAYVNPTASGWATTVSSALSLIAEGEGQSVEYEIALVGEGSIS